MAHEGGVFEGKTLDAAVKKGLDALGLSRAEVMITIIEEGSGGFLGLGARPYRVRVMRRPGGPPPAEPDEERRRRRDRGERGDRRPPRREGRDRDRDRDRHERRGPAGTPSGAPGRESRGDERRGERPRDERPRDERPRDERPRDERPRDERPRDERPRDGRPRDERPRDERPRDERSREERSREERPREERREVRRDERPRAERLRDERPRDERPRDERPRDERPRDERRRDEPREERPRDDRREEYPEEYREEHRDPLPAQAQEARPVSEGEGREEDGGPGDGRRRRRRGRRGGRRRHGAGVGPEGAAMAAEPVAEPFEDDELVDEMLEAPVAEAAEEPREPRELPREERPEPPREERRERHEFAREERRERHEPPRESRQSAAEPAGLPPEELAAQGRRMTEDLLKAMGFEATVTATADGNHVDVTAEVAQDEDLLTGSKGEVRQALQHLLNRILNRGESSRYHLQLEINDFWKRREEELRELARGLADEAVASAGEVVTEYLNAQERRIVHVTLRDDTRVKTYALGTGMIKRVAIAPADFAGGARDEGE